jgi:hypothetical protein
MTKRSHSKSVVFSHSFELKGVVLACAHGRLKAMYGDTP